MKKLSIVIVSSVMVASAAAGTPVPVKLLGDPATSAQAQRTIVITPETRYVNVTEGEIVTFVENGRAFTWDFDSAADVSSFALNRVAPEGVLDHPVTAYVARNVQMWD
jgi:hypothetical protein